MSTPFPTGQVWFSNQVTQIGDVPVSNAGLDYSNWPAPWGVQFPTDNPNPDSLVHALQHVGYALARAFGSINAGLLQANQDYRNGGSVSGSTWGQLRGAMNFINGLFQTTPRFAFPFVPRANINNPSPSADWTISCGQYSGTLTVHVDAETTSTNPTPSDYGSWQVVTGFVITLGESFSSEADREEPEDVEERPGGGGGYSSSSYYASSKSP